MHKKWIACGIEWHIALRALVAEFMGTAFVAFYACGAEVSTAGYGFLTTMDEYLSPGDEDKAFLYGADYHIIISVTFGFVTTVNTCLFQHVSGSHCNPVVTIGVMAIKKINPLRGFLYIVAQFIGGLVGVALLKALIPPLNHRDDIFTAHVWTEHGVSLWETALWIFLFSVLRVLTFMVEMSDSQPSSRATRPIVIGMTVMLGHMASGHATGGGNNPARVLGSAIVSNDFQDIWVFLIFSPVGGIIGAVLFYIFYLEGRNIHEAFTAHVDEPPAPPLPQPIPVATTTDVPESAPSDEILQSLRT